MALASPNSKYFGITLRADPTCSWPLILQLNMLRVFDIYLLSALKTIRLHPMSPPFLTLLNYTLVTCQLSRLGNVYLPKRDSVDSALYKNLLWLPLTFFRIETKYTQETTFRGIGTALILNGGVLFEVTNGASIL